MELLASPVARAIAGVVVLVVVYFLWLELRKIPAKLRVLMATAFVDMVGLLMVIPLLPFYARKLGADGVRIGIPGFSMHIGLGMVVAVLVTAITVAQLLSAPAWGRFSDRFGRRPALLIALGASAVAYVIFGFANSLLVLFLSRIVQGAGGGTVGVIQAYVADATEPENRAKALGWLSAATNLGVALGPVLGAVAVAFGEKSFALGAREWSLGHAAPGIFAAILCLVNMLFAWNYLHESRQHHGADGKHVPAVKGASRAAVLRVLTHSSEPAPRLIWIYAIAMGAFQGATAILALFLADRFAVDEKTIGYFFAYIGIIAVLTRALVLGKAVDRFGEAKLSRVGSLLLATGLATIPLAHSIPVLAISVALIPLGTAFTFPCVTSMLSRVIGAHERGLYMGVQQTYGGILRVAFPLVAGFSFDHLGKGVPFYLSGAMVIGTVFLGLGMEEYVRPKAREAAAG